MVAALIFARLGLATAPDPALILDAAREDKAGWVVAHLRGTPRQIGYQHGFLLSREIDDCLREVRFEVERGHRVEEAAYRKTRREMMSVLWPKVPVEYRQEMTGIAEGLVAKGYRYTKEDILLLNGMIEWGYYLAASSKPGSSADGHCSAFVCTGSKTADGKIVMGHSNWASFLSGQRWNAILDITPIKGHRILMDAMPGLIESGDDFAINSQGILLCETTIAGFRGFDQGGTPEFVRMRRAIQYSSSLDDVVRHFRTGNNGGYASTWLMGDRKRNEIGKLELGLRNVIFHRSQGGAYYGANYPEDDKLTAEECTVDLRAGTNSASDRRLRWQALFAQKGLKVDAAKGRAFLSDHHDERLGTDTPSYGTLCGHADVESRPSHAGSMPYAPAGAVQAKVVTAAMAADLSFDARMGRPCGEPFDASAFLTEHPQYAWQRQFLRDMPSRPWVRVSARQKQRRR